MATRIALFLVATERGGTTPFDGFDHPTLLP